MITAKIIADSIANNVRLVTIQLTYPRYIHAEFLTHRMFSRNSSSSRAIPVSKMLEQVRENPVYPVHWGANQPGMQARRELEYTGGVKQMWRSSADMASRYAEAMANAGLHKQIANRILEPYQLMHTVVTATEWSNFFKLRLHEDAQPEIHELARAMREAMDATPATVHMVPGVWHMPYLTRQEIGELGDKARLVSAARCARVSYRNHDQSEPDVEKDLELARRLLEAGHLSPFEHQATPMRLRDGLEEKGVTHQDWMYQLWSGNLRGWIQHRQLIDEP